MITALAQWLEARRDALLPRLTEQFETAAPQAATNGHSSVAHPAERAIWLASVYTGLVSAAQGDHAPLEECLRFARAMRAHAGEDELNEQLGLLFQFRRVASDALLDDPTDHNRDLLRALDALIDSSALALTTHWTASANAVAQQLHQAELLAASLNDATEHADRIALQLSNLNDIGRSLVTSLDPGYVLETIGGKLAEVLGADQVVICMSDGEGGLAVARSWGDMALEPGALVAGGDEDLVMRAFRTGEIVFETRPVAELQGPWFQPGCAVLAVPMLMPGKTSGVIVLQDDQPAMHLQPEQQSFVSSVASQAAMALENAGLYDTVRSFNAVLEQRIAEATRDLQNERDILGTLHQINLEVTGTLDIDLLLQTCLDMLAQLVGVEHGSVMLIERETDHLVDRAVLGGSVPGYNRFPIGQGIAGWVAQQKKPALVDNVVGDVRWLPPPEDDPAAKQGGSMIAVPLVAHHDVLGVILLSHGETGFFKDDHLRLLSASAGGIALGIYNALLYDQIQQELLRQGERLRNERRSAAQSYAILQSLSDGVIVCGAEGNVLAANPAASRILDRDVEELLTWHLPELLGRLLGPNSGEIPVEQVLQNAYGKNGRPRHYVTTFKIGPRVVSVSLDPVVLSSNEVLGAVTVFRDITREVESDRLKDEFIGTVSHELRTPMTSIKGYTQLMAMGSLGPLNDNQKEFLQTIHQNAERMISIINDLLDITKIETGSVINELDVRPLHLAEALSSVILELQPRIKAREQELVVQVPLGLPMVRVDARRFNQILANLISNAIKYTPRQGTLTVEATEVTEAVVPLPLREDLRPGRYVRVDVRDTGVGIAADEQSRIFERFYRTENALKIEAGGTGLGLALVRPLVKLFGGRIWLTSAVGEGSIFSFVVPIMG